MKQLFVISLLFLFPILFQAQGWVAGNGISNQNVRSLLEYNGDTLLAGLDNNGIYISYDNGVNWSQYALNNQTVWSLIKVGNTILAGTSGNGIYKTTNLGGQWQNVAINNLDIYSFTNQNDTLYFGSSGTMGPGAIYQSVDTGNTWNQYLSGFPYAFLELTFNPNNHRLLIASPFGAFYENNQNNLVATTSVNGTIRSVTHVSGDTIIYGGDNGTYVSYNNGSSGQTLSPNIGLGPIFKIADTLYNRGYVPSTGQSIAYNSTINGTWQTLPISSNAVSLNGSLNSLAKNNQRIIAGTSSGVYYYSKSLLVELNAPAISSEDIKLFPNPNRGQFTIAMDRFEYDLKVVLRNNLGQVISETIENPTNLMNFDFDVVEGVYFLELHSKGRTLSTIKFLKY